MREACEMSTVNRFSFMIALVASTPSASRQPRRLSCITHGKKGGLYRLFLAQQVGREQVEEVGRKMVHDTPLNVFWDFCGAHEYEEPSSNDV